MYLKGMDKLQNQIFLLVTHPKVSHSPGPVTIEDQTIALRRPFNLAEQSLAPSAGEIRESG